MRLLLDILQGAGLAAAAGFSPFLTALVVGALASANLGVDFGGTAFAFLESPYWLLGVVIALIAAVLLERRGLLQARAQSALAGIGIGIGALVFAGSLDDRFDIWWPGLIGGIACAALAGAAVRMLLARTRARLDAQAAAALPLYADGTAVALAALSVLAPPISVLALGFFAFLLRGGRRREGEKYAGLRILR